MGKQYFASFSSFKQDMEQFDHISQSLGFPSFLAIISEDGKSLANASPTKTQLALTCLQIALARLWMSWNIKPALVLGHSLGEYAALCIAGVLTISDTIYLVGSRAQLLETRCTKNSHSMLAVKVSSRQIKDLVEDDLIEVACINGPTDTVLSGEQSRIKVLERSLRDQGIKCTLLKVPFAFHSSQVDPILEEFHRIAKGVRFREATVSVLSPLRARAEKIFDADYLRDHCRQTVDFAGVLDAAQRTHVIQKGHLIIEIGPQPIVSGMFKSTLGHETNTLYCLAPGQDSWKLMATSLKSLYQSGHNINWVECNRDFPHRVIELPHYSWDLQHFWIDYVHNWSLRKGEPCPSSSAPHSIPIAAHQPQQPQQVLGVELDLSTTIHIASPHALFKENGQIVVESDICRSDLSQIVRGHEVDGFPLCTPSVYADIALSVGKYLIQACYMPLDATVTTIKDMNITKALIAKAKGSQILRTSVQYDRETNVASCKFESLTDTGSVHGEHATCSINFNDRSEKEPSPAETLTTQSKINALRQELHHDTAYQFNRSMIYKSIGALANFDSKYRGLLSVTMNSGSYEAYSTVDFSSIKAEGTFHTHPAFIDALSQIGGFVMNCNDLSDLNKEVYVNHGWGAFHMMEPISAKETYQAHVQMRETPNKLWKGDIIIMNGVKVVAKFADVALQCVPRRLLKHILASDGGKAATRPPNTQLPSVNTSQAVQVPSQANQSPQKPTSNLMPKLMDIISEESGIAINELGDDVLLDELGVDSLMSLLILGRIHEELEIDIDQSKFSHMETVGEIKACIGKPSGTGSTRVDDSPTTTDAQMNASRVASQTVLTNGHHTARQNNKMNFEDDVTLHVGHMNRSVDSELCNGALSTFATPQTNVSTAATTSSVGTDSVKHSFPISPHTFTSTQETRRHAPASSVTIQGVLKSAEKILFLLPDGSGSAHSYLDIPDVRPKLAIVGLNCPFRGDAAAMRYTSLESVTRSYVTEIRRRQPHGPYHLGGWSTGGILAYCVAGTLIDEGEKVSHLLLIDSPPPTGLDHLPQRFYDHCASTGVFGTRKPGAQGNAKPPDWLMPHFRATIDLLHDYHAEPLIRGHSTKTSILWAADCVFDGVQFELFPEGGMNEEEGEAVKFLTEKRVDLSAGAWACLFSGGHVSVTVANGAHHFSLMVCLTSL